MAEVKAQPGRIDHRACLLHVDAQHRPQRGVQQVRRGVIAAGCRAPFRAHLTANNIALGDSGDGGDFVNGQARHGRISGLNRGHGLPGPVLQLSVIAHLAAGFGVETGGI